MRTVAIVRHLHRSLGFDAVAGGEDNLEVIMHPTLESAALKMDLLLQLLEGNDSNASLFRSGEGRASVRALSAELRRMSRELDLAPREGVAMQMLVRASGMGRDSALDEIRTWLKGAQSVTLCDPFLFHSPTPAYPSNEAYADAVVKLFPPSATKVTLYFNGYEEAIRTLIWPRLKEGRSVTLVNTSQVHDRFVGRDEVVRLVGTSLGGLGNKLSVIVDLEPEDARGVLGTLEALKETARERIRHQRSEAAIWIPAEA
ncbi:hypothetical protein DMC25_16895 [Caulobacter sp. D4A]|nr:hypothetical protein DMC25_16895 [Caulobacter sp. D4A]